MESIQMHDGNGVKRREFIKSAALVSAGSVALGSSAEIQAGIRDELTDQRSLLQIKFQLNGSDEDRKTDPRTTLLDLLREEIGLFGTKKGCDHGACGACTVHINGRRELACLTLAATIDGMEVTTIEGIAEGENLHPMQEAFLRCDAYQCGYCTPGQIMSGIACIEEGHAVGSPEETREWMSGNLCRCSAYPNILAAVRQVSGVEPPNDPSSKAVVISDAPREVQPKAQRQSAQPKAQPSAKESR